MRDRSKSQPGPTPEDRPAAANHAQAETVSPTPVSPTPAVPVVPAVPAAGEGPPRVRGGSERDVRVAGQASPSPADRAEAPERPGASHTAHARPGTDGETGTGTDAGTGTETGRKDPLIDSATADRLRRRWTDVQSGFVDDPRAAVRQARDLASEAVAALSDAVEDRRRSLGAGSPSGDPDEQADTERLRQVLRGQRELVHRLLEV